MNEYISLVKNNTSISNLSSVSMLLSGKYIEDVIEGYKTLNVYGREEFEYEIDSTRRVGGDGSMFHFESVPPRPLEVEYQLLSNTPEEQQAKFNELKILLSRMIDSSIRFRDEMDYRWYGYLGQMDKVDSSKLNVVATFTIMCLDPYKYKDAISTSGEITIATNYETYPDRIIVTIPTARNDLIITNTNTNKTIRLNGEIGASSTIELIPHRQIIKVNDQLRNDLLVLNSDFENFEINKGDVLKVNAGTMEVYQREKAL